MSNGTKLNTSFGLSVALNQRSNALQEVKNNEIAHTVNFGYTKTCLIWKSRLLGNDNFWTHCPLMGRRSLWGWIRAFLTPFEALSCLPLRSIWYEAWSPQRSQETG